MALTVQPGETYTLGHEDGHGTGIGALPPGTSVTVDEVHDEPTAGVGGGIVVSVPVGTVRDIEVRRRIAFPLDDFERLFTKDGS